MKEIAPHIPQIISMIGVLAGLFSLNWYRMRKKFKEKAVDSAWQFLDQNIVEIIHAGVIAPNVGNVLFKLIPGAVS